MSAGIGGGALSLSGGAFIGAVTQPEPELINHTLRGERIPAKQVVCRTMWGTPMLPDGKGGYSVIAPINQEYIARVLCVNKAKPEMGCNGQCHLMKQMEKETKKEQNGNAVKDKYEVVIAAIQLQAVLQPYFTAVKIATAYNSGFPLDPLTAVFHPPQA